MCRDRVEKYDALVHKARHAQRSAHEARVVEDLAMMYMVFYESNGGEVFVRGKSELECYKAFVSEIDAVGIECDEEGNEKQ